MSRLPLTEQDLVYAELLLAWARTSDEHGLSFEAYSESLESDTEPKERTCTTSN